MPETKVYLVPGQLKTSAHLDKARYEAMYRASIENPETFWKEQAETFLDWLSPFEDVYRGDMRKGEAHWFRSYGQVWFTDATSGGGPV